VKQADLVVVKETEVLGGVPTLEKKDDTGEALGGALEVVHVGAVMALACCKNSKHAKWIY